MAALVTSFYLKCMMSGLFVKSYHCSSECRYHFTHLLIFILVQLKQVVYVEENPDYPNTASLVKQVLIPDPYRGLNACWGLFDNDYWKCGGCIMSHMRRFMSSIYIMTSVSLKTKKVRPNCLLRPELAELCSLDNYPACENQCVSSV